jgi:glucosamine--fructose-6-phosphate aminotransferase (isomerizing)
MCGIVGYLGNENYSNYIINGLKLLQNRGYDSAGLSYLYEGSLKTHKYASTDNNNSIKLLEDSIDLHEKSHLAIGHTRWATHGPKNNINAHPHHDNDNMFSIVHNGIIENFQQLKEQLVKENFVFHSQTDTEVIAVILGKYYAIHNNIEKAIECTVMQLQGTWALVIIHKDFPEQIWLTRNGSPLLLGIEEEFVLIVSEQLAFNNHIKSYIIIENHDIIHIKKTENKIEYNENIKRYPIKTKLKDDIIIKPENYEHWTLKEIMEQPDAIKRCTNNGGRIDDNISVKLGGLEQNKSRLLECEHAILLGCGTSYHSSLWSQEIFKSLDIFSTVHVFDGAEFNITDIPKKGKTCILLCSQSGETKDLHRCIHIAKEYDLPTIGVVNVVDSLIARDTDCGVYLNAGREIAVASTKSFTNQCIILSMIAVWFSQNKGTSIKKRKSIIDSIRHIPFQIQNTFKNVSLRTFTQFLDKKTLFILGKDKELAIAKEGSLKIKEICYIHAEGYSSSALKHGPFALVEENLPIIILDIGDKNREKNRNAYEELISRKANVIYITDKQTDIENHILIENNEVFGGLIANICIQLIGYYKAVENHINPDFPRNLAKVVTVE